MFGVVLVVITLHWGTWTLRAERNAATVLIRNCCGAMMWFIIGGCLAWEPATCFPKETQNGIRRKPIAGYALTR